MASKAYVVRGMKGARTVYAYGPGMGFSDACEEIPAHEFERLDAAAGARDHMVKLGCEASIFRVLDDGREERLPSYEEALAEIDRLREIEGANILNANALRLARENLSTTLDMAPNTSMYDLQNEARRRLGADPLAALEAAERRLLEAGGWTAGDRGFWIDPDDGTQWPREGAISDVRRRLAAKGGA